jgi:hypothetical protein
VAGGLVVGLAIYVGNNPLKYRDPTGHFPLISWGGFVSDINAYKANQSALDIWVGEAQWVWLGFCVLSLLLSLRMWAPMCRALLCCFASLVEMSSEGR